MRKALLVIASFLVVCTCLQAQDEESLTHEFPHLTARERSRIAKREAVEAPRDEAFQTVMRTADELFQEGRYEEALERYLEARSIRPYNVYPKVKAQDLQALLERRAAEVPQGPALPVAKDTLHEVLPAGTVTVVDPRRQEARAPSDPKPEDKLPAPRTRSPETPDGKEVRPADEGYGLVERHYREGRADVLERRLTRDGQTTTYRRVRHPWGAVFHFKDGETISATAWDQAFPEEGD